MTRRLSILTAAALGALTFAAPAMACLPQTKAGVFAAWGDQNAYALMSKVDPNDAKFWSLSNGADAAVDDSPFTGDLSDQFSIQLPPGGVAWSPAVCAGSEFTAFRFFARTANLVGNGTGGIEVTAILEDGARVTFPTLIAGSRWNATPRMQGSLGRYFDLKKIGAVRLVFRNAGTNTYRIDDIHYDPYAKKDA